MSVAKNFLFGFVITTAVAAGFTLLLGWILFGFETLSDLKDSIPLALAATAVFLVAAGGEIAISFLFSRDRPIGVKITQFLGAVFAVVVAFFMLPLIGDWLDDSKNARCDRASGLRIGAVTFFGENCGD